ncbi:SRSO17 transposase [Streptomyces violarus]|uniref:SRSO17 transposase n=1 Tax=Streptomyces violarus TaxID=67380 RepID=A0A7W5A008_9ACTN|nr:hypothetical protein [Streptomyces violarus]MBB3081657.1 SRSO17 transposase [Streptomyces violarus]
MRVRPRGRTCGYKKTGRLVRETSYFLCHTDPGATLAALVTAAGQRWMVEESFQVAKGQVGLDEHEVRKWCSWYRYTTVCSSPWPSWSPSGVG